MKSFFIRFRTSLKTHHRSIQNRKKIPAVAATVYIILHIYIDGDKSINNGAQHACTFIGRAALLFAFKTMRTIISYYNAVGFYTMSLRAGDAPFLNPTTATHSEDTHAHQSRRSQSPARPLSPILLLHGNNYDFRDGHNEPIVFGGLIRRHNTRTRSDRIVPRPKSVIDVVPNNVDAFRRKTKASLRVPPPPPPPWVENV